MPKKKDNNNDVALTENNIETFPKALNKLDNLLTGFFSGINHFIFVARAKDDKKKKNEITDNLTKQLHVLFNHINVNFKDAFNEHDHFTKEEVEKLKQLLFVLNSFKEKSFAEKENYKLSDKTKKEFDESIETVKSCQKKMTKQLQPKTPRLG